MKKIKNTCMATRPEQTKVKEAMNWDVASFHRYCLHYLNLKNLIENAFVSEKTTVKANE